MKRLVCLLSFLSCLGASTAWAHCPHNAVFLALEDQIRGYSLRANGPVAPCQVIQGPNTTLQTARAIAISKNGYLHTAQFLTNGTISIFRPTANGDDAPSRSLQLETNDLVGIAVDSHVNDFVVSIRQFPPSIFVLPPSASGQQQNPTTIEDPSLFPIGDVAIDEDRNLLVGGHDSSGVTAVQTFKTSRTLKSPPIIRTISGSATGLFPHDSNPFAPSNLSIALDPSTDELYVYNVSVDGTNIQVSVFAPEANGNVAPIRVISGEATGITGPGFPGANKIALSSDGRLFVAEPNNRILVFAPGASGNVPPSQVIQDSTIGSNQVEQGGIAVRSCRCR
jgi:hypothetical protein